MPVKNILEKFKEEEVKNGEDLVELNTEQMSADVGNKIQLEIDKIEDFADSDRVQKKLREGKILVVKIKDLKEKDMGELKRAISRIRKTCLAVNGDIVGASDDWIIVTPEQIRINRTE